MNNLHGVEDSKKVPKKFYQGSMIWLKVIQLFNTHSRLSIISNQLLKEISKAGALTTEMNFGLPNWQPRGSFKYKTPLLVDYVQTSVFDVNE